MEKSFSYFADLGEEIQEIPTDSILSRALFSGEKVKVTLFGFDQGQELTEHTAASPAILYFVKGEADLTLGEEQRSAGPGTWVYMPARLPHSLMAKTPLIMLLMLLSG